MPTQTRDEARAESAAPERELDRLTLLSTLARSDFELIRHADRKAQLLLRIALTLFMVAFIGVPPSVVALRQFLADGGWKAGLFVSVVVLYGLCSVCLIGSMMKIIACIRPRLELAPDHPSRLIYNEVARMDPATFGALIRDMERAEAIEDFVSQVHSSAVITDHKYRKLNEAISWMMSGGLFGVIFALILLVTVGLT